MELWVLVGSVRVPSCPVLDKHRTQVWTITSIRDDLHFFDLVITVLVSDDAEKRDKLGKEYNLKTYSYAQFPLVLESGECDAFYIATPNNMHRTFAAPALEHGYHVLLEKPMEVSVEDCQAMIDAQKTSGAKLMIAYRLHHEPGTLEVIHRVRKGDFGDPRIFSSVFTQDLKPENHRAKHGFDAGPVPDLGAYPINAVRNIFGLEPFEVTAIGFKTPGRDYLQMEHDTISVTLRFPGDRLAQFVVSFATAPVEGYKVVGTAGNDFLFEREMSNNTLLCSGEIVVEPGYIFGKGVKIAYKAKINDKEESKTFPETDHFGGETEYFSECILKNVDPEADGEDGLNDVRVITAIKESLEKNGKTIKLEPRDRKKRPTLDQAKELPLAKEPASLIGRDSQKPS